MSDMRITEKIIIAALAVLLIFQLVLNHNLTRISNELSGRVNSLQNTVVMLQSNVTSEVSTIMNRIKEENSIIKSVQWETVKMNNGVVTVKCEAGFNQMSDGGVPYLLYKAGETGSWNKIGLEHVEGLIYSANIDLRPQESYTYQVFIDGETQYSGNTEGIEPYIYQYADFRGMILGDYDHRSDNSKTRRVVNLEPVSKAIFEPLQMQAAEVVLYSSGKKIDSVVMRKADNTSSSDAKPEYFSGSDSQIAMPEPFYGMLSAELNFGDYKEVIDRITIKATYNDGYTVEKEVYPKIEE